MDHTAPFYDAWLFSLTCVAAFTDARGGVIPNWLTLPTLAAAPLAHALLSGPGALAWSLAGAVASAAVPSALFVRGAMGGGDVKLFAAAGALIGAHGGLELQVVTYGLAALGATVRLVCLKQLGAVLRRVLALLVRSARPAKGGCGAQVDTTLDVRLGIAAFAACLVLALRGAPELLP
jgi:prepilin peptidase CpaA